MSNTIAQFKSVLNSNFTVYTAKGAIELSLREAVEKQRPGLPSHFNAPISLVFAGPRHAILVQAAYYFDHLIIGRNQWLLAPINKYATLEHADVDSQDETTLPLYEVLLG